MNIPSTKLCASLGLILGLCATAALAAPPDRSPLLRIHLTFTEYRPSSVPFGPQIPTDTHQDLVITNDGTYRSTLYSAAVGARKWETMWVNGQATELNLRRLRSTLAETQVGLLADCGFADLDYPGLLEFTWFGRNRRTHTFRVVLSTDPAAQLAPCSSAMTIFREELARFEREILRDPRTETLR